MVYNKLITVKHNTTGKIFYTFQHWPRQFEDGKECLSVVEEYPDNKTRVVYYVPVDEVEFVSETEYK